MVLTSELQHLDNDEFLRLPDGSPLLSRRAGLNADLLAATVPTTRLFRVVNTSWPIASGDAVNDQPFEEGSNCRVLPCAIEAGEYSMADCYERVENICLANGARELRRIAFEILGHTNVRPEAITINMVQHGNQHFIFQIDCQMEEYPGETQSGTRRFSLVASVARHPQMNPLVKADHQGLMALKKGAEQVPDMAGLASIPDHYGFYEAKGKPSLYLAPYLAGYCELNPVYVCGPLNNSLRGMMANGINQGHGTSLLPEDLAAALRIRIMLHHFILAMKTNKMMHSSLAAGDYMYNAETGDLALHCYRDFNLANVPGAQFDPMLTLIFEIFKTCNLGSKIAALAHQIAITMLTEEMGAKMVHFAFDEFEFGVSIEALVQGKMISREDLNKVVVLLTGIQTIITQTSPDPTNEIYLKYLKRINNAAALCLGISQMAHGHP